MTVVTIVTLIFTPVLKNHKWVEMLTGTKTETQIVNCVPHDPCPKQKTIVEKIVLPPQH